MTTYRFEVFRYPVKKSYRCHGCKKMQYRATTFTGTSNPFSTPPYMDYAQMRERLKPKIDAWLEVVESALCTKCDVAVNG